MDAPVIDDELWILIESLLPPPKPRRKGHPGRPRVSDHSRYHSENTSYRPAMVASMTEPTSKPGRSSEYTRLMAVAVRSFCHFLFLRGDTARDLYESVPSVRKWRQSTVPTFLTPEQQEALESEALCTCRGNASCRLDWNVSFRHDDGTWCVFPPATERLVMRAY
jgi:transposase